MEMPEKRVVIKMEKELDVGCTHCGCNKVFNGCKVSNGLCMAYVLKHHYFTVFKISDSTDVLFDSI